MARLGGKIAGRGSVMNTLLAYAKSLAPAVSAAVIALTPFYGGRSWFVGVAAGVLALAHITPSILPSSPPKQ